MALFTRAMRCCSYLYRFCTLTDECSRAYTRHSCKVIGAVARLSSARSTTVADTSRMISDVNFLMAFAFVATKEMQKKRISKHFGINRLFYTNFVQILHTQCECTVRKRRDRYHWCPGFFLFCLCFELLKLKKPLPIPYVDRQRLLWFCVSNVTTVLSLFYFLCG